MGKSTLEEMRRLAKRRGGKCVSTRYTNLRVALWWRCEYRHLWKALPTNVRKGSWCPICANTQPLMLTEMRALAARRGGECVSDQYVSNETKLRWRCAAGHQWEAAPGLVKAGRWCPHCARVARLSLNAMTAIATSRGGRRLSTEYINVETPLLWKCGAGHRWIATPASVRARSWCPYCVRNQKLELKEMHALARKRGGRCLSNRYINNRSPLLWECGRSHRWKAAPCNVRGGARKRGTWCQKCYDLRRRFRPRDTIERMKIIARARGGHCLSAKYLNSKSKLLWQCEKGHQWRAVPVAVTSGTWCPVCAQNRRLTLQELRSLAAGRGGRCLSRRYTNKATTLEWQCAEGHRWRAQPGRVKRGSWCPKCANLKRRSPWKLIA
jgi:hypothetical protein